jgi:hypothetical protein
LRAGEPSGERVFGDILADPGVVSVITDEFPESLSPEEIAGVYDEIEPGLAKIDDGFTLQGAMTRDEINGERVLQGRYVGPGGLNLARAVVVRPGGVARVDVVYWPRSAPEWEAVAARVAASARPEP